VATRIEEFRVMQADRHSSGRPSSDRLSPESPIETALFLEDAFGITLEEEEIDARHLGPEADLSAFVLRKLRGE